MKPLIYMVSPPDLEYDEIVCEPGFEKNFPDRTFIEMIEKSEYDRLRAAYDLVLMAFKLQTGKSDYDL